jgi:hypothetical protein
MRLNLGNFFVKKPLRWMFSQLFGSKIKNWFDSNVSLIIDASLASGILNLDGAVSQFLESDFVDKMLKEFVSQFRLPKSYEVFAEEYIREQIKNKINKALN